MGYSHDLRKSALRHLRAGQVLYEREGPGDQPGCSAVAGYLFGIAGELAIKELMRMSGMWPRDASGGGENPFYAHFPSLKNMLTVAQGRRAGELRQLGDDPRFFQNWDIRMRYAPATDVKEEWVAAWKGSAEEVIRRMELA